jgi:hypothetical protein
MPAGVFTIHSYAQVSLLVECKATCVNTFFQRCALLFALQLLPGKRLSPEFLSGIAMTVTRKLV